MPKTELYLKCIDFRSNTLVVGYSKNDELHETISELLSHPLAFHSPSGRKRKFRIVLEEGE